MGIYLCETAMINLTEDKWFMPELKIASARELWAAAEPEVKPTTYIVAFLFKATSVTWLR
jgi:hypothetical protein